MDVISALFANINICIGLYWRVSLSCSKLAQSVNRPMCIYNANKATREATVKEESLKVLAEGVKSPSEVKVLDTQQESPHAKENVAKELEKALKMAQKESRVVIGVPAAVKFLSAAPEDSLFCILAPPKMRDSATHIQEVLLKAFCLENDIYIIQVCGSFTRSKVVLKCP